MRREAIVILWGAVAVTAGGCWVAYRPSVPHEEVGGGGGARVVSVTTMADDVSVDVVVDAAQRARAANAWLTTPAASPCASGVPARAQQPGMLRAEERVLSFDAGAAGAAGLLGALPTVIDLDVVPGDPLGARRCVRLPITQATDTVEWRASPRWFVAAGLRSFEATRGPNAVGGGTLVSFGGGMWLGPVRLRLDWLVGEATTDRPPPVGYSKSTAQLIGGDAAAEIFPLHLGPWGLGAQVGYEYLATDFTAQSGATETDVYDAHGPRGPRVALRLARLPQPRRWRGFAARPDSWSIGLDLFAARWSGVDGSSPLRYGLAIGGEWGRWW
jgi:hypothetical protein